MAIRLWIALGVFILTFLYQNCSNVKFDSDESASLAPPPQSLSNPDTRVETNLNTPVEFIVNHAIPTGGTSITFTPLNPNEPLKGTFEVVNSDTFTVKFTPALGFRGTESAVATVRDQNGNDQKFNVIVTVGNSLKSFQPALAVRGMGCIQCHAQVSSNIITDFGFTNDYYFGAKPNAEWWKSGSVYGDHSSNFNTMALPADKSIFVPKAELPAIVANATKLGTLADYIRSEFSSSGNAGTRNAKVVESANIYIGAPSGSALTKAFNLGNNERIKYFKNSSASVEFSGLQDEGKFFRNMGLVNCEGDVVLRGPLLLENLQLNSKAGCRLHVIGSVFIFGGIVYKNADADRNLQILSTKSISLGLGSAKKGDTFCEPKGRYATDTANYGTSSLTNRYVSFWTVQGQFLRQSSDPASFGKSVVGEAEVIQAKAGMFYDAACRPEGRNVSFDRILLNAPVIHSRYEGNVSGTIIAEYSIMSLGMFKFSFDPVFARVPVFPFIDPALYLHIE